MALAIAALTLGVLPAFVIFLVALRRPLLLIDAPRVVAAFVVLATLASLGLLIDGSGGFPRSRVRLDASEAPLLLRGDPARDVYAQAVATFGDDDLYVIAMVTRDGIFTPGAGHLDALRRIAKRLRALDGVRSVDVLPDLVVPYWNARDGLVEVGPFLEDELPQDPLRLAAEGERALREPLIAGTLLSRDGRAAGIHVSFVAMDDERFVLLGIDAAIAAVLAEESGEGRTFHVTGRPHVKTRAHDRMAADLSTLIPAAVAVGALVARLVTGSLRSAVIPVGSSLLATLWTFAVLAALGRSLTLITLVLAPLLICVGSVYGVHVLARFDDLGRATRDASSRAVALACLRSVRLPVAIAGATTSAGFAALACASTDAVRELGLAALFGTAAVSGLSLAALPALLAVIGRPAGEGQATTGLPPGSGGAIGRAIDIGLARLAALVAARTDRVLLVWGALAVVAALLIPRIEVDTDYLRFFDVEDPVRRDFRAVGDALAGAVPLYVTITGRREGLFRDPQMLAWLDRRIAGLRGLGDVDEVVSIVDFLRTANRALEGGDEAALVLPPGEGATGEILLLLPKNRLRRVLSADRAATNLILRSRVGGSSGVRELARSVREVLAREASPEPVAIEVTGNVVITNRGADGIAGDQLSTVAATTVAIFALVAVAFGSPALAGLAMIPNVVPVLMFFGLLGLGAASLSLPTSLVGCIALGIAVDDTAHFLASYRRLRAGGRDSGDAVAVCVRTLGRPIVATSAMLVAGFLVVGCSSFATLREFGILSATTMVVCLAADLILLPALLLRLRA